MKTRQQVQGRMMEISWRQEQTRVAFQVLREEDAAATAEAGAEPGALREADVVEVEPGIYSVLIEGRSYDVRLEHAHYGDFAQIGPWRVRLEPAGGARGSGARGSSGPAQVLSRMPGRVVRVLVAEGDAVTEGQGLLVLEAMKMQNEIAAPRAGTVRGLSVAEGGVVAAGALLCRIE